ncbi:MAG: DUF433 domain-containing protein [Lacipirellulaceae bacterium]
MEPSAFDPSILASLPDPRELPNYTVPEAAGNLDIPTATVRAWVFGTTTGSGDRKKRFAPVIASPFDGAAKQLSYFNLAEVFVLRALRKQYGINLQDIREALDGVRCELQCDRPLLHEGFKTDGVRLFIDSIPGPRDAKSGQLALFHAHLGRVEWEDRLASRLYPFASLNESVDSPRPVVIDMRRAFGRPVVDRIGVPTEELYSLWRAGDSIEQIAENFRCQREDVEVALRYETKDHAA